MTRWAANTQTLTVETPWVCTYTSYVPHSPKYLGKSAGTWGLEASAEKLCVNAEDRWCQTPSESHWVTNGNFNVASSYPGVMTVRLWTSNHGPLMLGNMIIMLFIVLFLCVWDLFVICFVAKRAYLILFCCLMSCLHQFMGFSNLLLDPSSPSSSITMLVARSHPSDVEHPSFMFSSECKLLANLPKTVQSTCDPGSTPVMDFTWTKLFFCL